MLYWLYEIPVLLVVGLFALLFVGLCWIGIIFVSPIVAPWFQAKQQLNEVLGDYLQYFGVIYGLLLGLLAVATYQITLTSRRLSQARHHRLPLYTGTLAPIPNPIAAS